MRFGAVAALAFVLSCDAEPVVLVVDVQTDLVPGVEFASVQVQLGGRTESLGAAIGDDFSAPRRVAEIADVPLGTVELSVVLVDAGGMIVLGRDLSVELQRSLGLTVVLTRGCVGVVCSEAGPSTVATTCVDGRCLPPSCSPQSPAACGTPACEVTRDCAVRAECASADCADGVCLAFGDASRCATGEYCHPVDGCTVLPAGAGDADGDGVVDDVDCDPADPLVGFRAERPCAGECATGLEECVSGNWLPCDAPTDCSCEIGETRTITCARCGSITQTCETGTWASGTCDAQGECTPGSFEDVGACGRCGTERRACLDDCSWDVATCTAEGICGAGETEIEEESCGTCGEVRTRSRTCGATCNWGPWSPFSACAMGGGCTPGTMETQMQACGACGTQTRTRTCRPDCVFDPWTVWGACTGEGECITSTPATESQACGSCGTGSQIRSRTCTTACAWGPWSGYSTCSVPAAVSLAGGMVHTCGIFTDGSLRCWGSNEQGQIGDGTLSTRSTPTRVGSATGWTRMDTGGRFDGGTDMMIHAHTCGIRAGQLWCWGENRDGQLGINSIIDSDTPVRVGTATNWTDVSAALRHTCGVRTGQLYCWGSNATNRLGTGGADVRVPTRVGTGTSWSRVSAGDTFTCALQTSGSLYCWGSNFYGQLGLGDNSARSTPVRVGTASWLAISAGTNFSCGIQTSGALYCWGDPSDGRLGNGSTSMGANAPLRVGMASDWTAIYATHDHACGLRGTGTLHCWGDGGEGQCGVLPAQSHSTPVQVGTETDWASIAGGNEYSCAVRAGRLYCWGLDNAGRLGNGSGRSDQPEPFEACF